MPRSRNDGSNSNSGFIELVERLAQLEFREFQHVIFLWLAARGFRHMRFLGRNHRRGRRQRPGADLTVVPPGLLSSPIAVQIRHWKTPVQKRAVDELRGYMLRSGVSSGLIITSSVFSKAARVSSTEFPGRPIHLVSVHELAKSMESLGLGVKEDKIDEPFFRSLRHLAFASSFLHGKSTPRKRRVRRLLRLSFVDRTDGENLAKNGNGLFVTVGLVLLFVLTVLYFVYVGGLR